MAVHLSLLVPGLFGEQRFALDKQTFSTLNITALDKFCSRAASADVAADNVIAAMAGLFSMDESSKLPIAMLSHLADASDDKVEDVIENFRDDRGAIWLRADPVHLRADRDCVVMVGGENLEISAEEAQQWAADINAQFEEDGWQFEVLNNNHWYLRLNQSAAISTTPLPDVIGHNIHDYMPHGADQKYWRSLMNEIQMLLFSSELNQSRERDGRLTVNSVWFWGEGEQMSASDCSWQHVYSDDALLCGLAKWHNVPCSNAPQSASQWLDGKPVDGEHLLFASDAASCLALGNIERWLRFVEDFDQNWLAPLLDGLSSGEIDSVTLYPLNGSSFSLSARQLRAWRLPLSIFRRKLSDLFKVE